MARYEDAGARLSNALRARTGPGGEEAAAAIARRFVAALEVCGPHHLLLLPFSCMHSAWIWVHPGHEICATAVLDQAGLLCLAMLCVGRQYTVCVQAIIYSL